MRLTGPHPRLIHDTQHAPILAIQDLQITRPRRVTSQPTVVVLGTWLFLHRATFVVWFGAMTVHVLTYVWRLPELVGRDLASRAGRRAYEVLGGRSARWLLLAASVLTGLLLAVLTVHSAGAWIRFFSGQGH
jgi:hypothetical protein